MRVAYVIDSLIGGGAERVVERLARGLHARGHGVLVCCLRAAGPPGEDLARAGVRVIDLCSQGHDLMLPLRLARACAAHRVQVIHTHSSAALLAALPARLLPGVRLVHTRHGDLLGRPSRYRRWADRAAPLVDRTVVVARALLASLPSRRIAARTVWIPNGVDLPQVPRDVARAALEAHCGGRVDGPIVLSVGTICAEKATLTLVEAFARVRTQHSAARLVCVGAPRGADYAAAVQARCGAPDLAGAVVLAGAVDDAWRLMGGADVFCLPSQTEAMPLAIVEAMSQRAPIVATAVGDVGRIDPLEPDAHAGMLRDRHSGLLTRPGDVDAIAAAILESLANPQAAQARAAHAHANYRRLYTAERLIARHEALYREQTAAPHPPRASLRRPGVVLIGPDRAAIGGINSVIDVLADSPLGQRCDVSRFAWPPQRAGGGVISGALRQLRAAIDLARAVRRERAALVHVHACSGWSFYRGLLDVVVARLCGARTLLHVHGGRFADFVRQTRGVARWVIRAGLEAADAVAVLSERTRAELRPHAPRAELVVVPNPVRIDESRPPQPSDATVRCHFVYLGELRIAKGVLDLLDAAERLCADGVDFELTLAGPTSVSESIDWSGEIARRGLSGCVRRIGAVQGDDKRRLFARADCLVLPSRVEAMPMVVLEAAAAGIAVIATQVGDLPELLVCDETRRPWGPYLAPLAAPRDAAALAAAMRQIAGDAGMRTAIARDVHARVAAVCGAARVASLLGGIYDRLLRKSRRARCGWGERVAGGVIYPIHEALRGRPTIRALAALQQSAAMTVDDLTADVSRRLGELLAFAHEHLPLYRRQLDAHKVDLASRTPCAELPKLPILEKALVRAHQHELTWVGVPGGLHPMTSGGTTGDTLRFAIDNRRAAEDHAARLFMQSLFGVQPGDRRVHIWGSPIESRPGRVRRVRDWLLNELLLSAFELSAEQADWHLDRIRRFRPRVIYGYPSALDLLARRVSKRVRRDLVDLRLVVLTGEALDESVRARVADAFGVPVASEYGNREVGLIAHDCPAGRMHVIAPHILVEIFDDSGPVPPSAGRRAGRILCTTLNTRGQPFIRYAVGDVGRWASTPCPCRLPFPVLELIGGKISGLLVLPDGRMCHGAVSSHAIQGLAGIVAFRTHQRSLRRLEVLLQVDGTFDPQSVETIRSRYLRLLGPAVEVDCRVVDCIPPDPSGKRRHFISDVAPDLRRFELAVPQAT